MEKRSAKVERFFVSQEDSRKVPSMAAVPYPAMPSWRNVASICYHEA